MLEGGRPDEPPHDGHGRKRAADLSDVLVRFV